MQHLLKFLALAIAYCSLLTGISACGAAKKAQERGIKEYMQAKMTTPLIFPQGVDTPENSSVFNIPDLPDNAQTAYTPEQLIQPPSLLGPLQPTTANPVKLKTPQQQPAATTEQTAE